MKFVRRAQIATIVVGEGNAEVALLTHLKALYLPRGCGTSLKIACGYGKGGKGVLDYAERVCEGRAYDRQIALLDTDTDWNSEQRARAARLNISVVESSPCIEAWLLAIYGDNKTRTSAAWKREFNKKLGMPAHDTRVYQSHFEKKLLDAQRMRVATLDQLLTLLTT